MRIAITRPVSRSIDRCELTHVERQPIDWARADAQHRRYEQRLADLGCRMIRLPEEPDLPDSVFVEDTAVVLGELAVVTRPGAEPRRPETAGVAEALLPYRSVLSIQAPGTLDGGDVLTIDRQIYVGRSLRSNDEGIEQLRTVLFPFGYAVHPVEIRSCLHLKSAVTRVAPGLLLLNPDWVDGSAFGGMKAIPVDPAEPPAANALLVGETVLYPAAFPRTAERLTRQGVRLLRLDLSELAKAEGGVTCCSIIFEI